MSQDDYDHFRSRGEYEQCIKIATQNGRLDIVEQCIQDLEKHRDVNPMGDWFRFGLREAIRNGKTDVSEFFIKKLEEYKTTGFVATTSDFIMQINIWNTPFEEACERGHKDIVALLVKKIDFPESGFRAAARNGHQDVMLFLKDFLKESDHPWDIALEAAAANGNRNLIEFCLSQGATPIAGIKGAIRGDHKELVALFLKKGADVNQSFIEAVVQGRREIVEYLISQGANDFHAAFAALVTSFHSLQADILEILFQHGVKDYTAALARAAYLEQFDLADDLIKRGADVNGALKKISEYASVESLEYLVQKGAVDTENRLKTAQQSVQHRGDENLSWFSGTNTVNPSF